MMDELRDYRFYGEDMIHPSQLAINYIWETFKKVWISDPSYTIMDDVDLIQKGLFHKPFNPESHAHKAFLEKLETKKTSMNARFPEMRF